MAPAIRRTAERLRVDAATVAAIDVLAAAGIPSIVLKGASFARWLYGPGEHRRYNDGDLLVPPPFEAASAVLAGTGFRLYNTDRINPWPKHAKLWVRDRDGAAVDLHHVFHGVTVSHADTWEALSARTEPLHLAGRTVSGLDVVGRALILTLHAAANGPGRTQDELARAVPLVTDDEWLEVQRVADRLGAADAFRAALHHGPPAARALALRLGIPTDTSVAWLLRAHHDHRTKAVSLRLERLATLPGARAKAVFLWRSVFPLPEQVRIHLSTHPDRPQHLVYGYTWHLAAGARAAARAVRQWRRARRDAARRGGL